MPQYNLAIQRLQMPKKFQKLLIDERGYPIPKFVQMIDGKPDFRVIDARWFTKAIKQDLCWLCGEKLGRFKAFVIGPMCAINRVNSEPPSHLECARFAVKACPFMVFPERKRNEDNLPENRIEAAGEPIKRNPGVMVIWVTQSYTPFRPRAGNQGILISLGDPTSLEWYTRGRHATRPEVIATIESGIPVLRKIAASEGPNAIKEIDRQIQRVMQFLPRESDTCTSPKANSSTDVPTAAS